MRKYAQPVVHAPRRVPAPLPDKLSQELERITLMGVKEKVGKPIVDQLNSV